MSEKDQAAKSVNETTKPRRKLFQLLVAAGFTSAVLPREWVKPVVGQVVLPAHADVSDCEDDEDCCPDSADDLDDECDLS